MPSDSGWARAPFGASPGLQCFFEAGFVGVRGIWVNGLAVPLLALVLAVFFGFFASRPDLS